MQIKHVDIAPTVAKVLGVAPNAVARYLNGGAAAANPAAAPALLARQDGKVRDDLLESRIDTFVVVIDAMLPENVTPAKTPNLCNLIGRGARRDRAGDGLHAGARRHGVADERESHSDADRRTGCSERHRRQQLLQPRDRRGRSDGAAVADPRRDALRRAAEPNPDYRPRPHPESA